MHYCVKAWALDINGAVKGWAWQGSCRGDFSSTDHLSSFSQRTRAIDVSPWRLCLWECMFYKGEVLFRQSSKMLIYAFDV
jgi:hypothetical protein